MPPSSTRKPRVRKPVQSRAFETRAAIVRAAGQVLARRGYAGATTNHVAARAGVSIGTLYEYFRDKDQLVLAAVTEHLAEGESLIAARAGALASDALERPLRDSVAALVEGMVAFHASNPRLHRVLTSEVPHSRAVIARAEALEEKLIALISAVLSAHPEARVSDPQLAARVCVQTVEALTHRWLVDKSGTPVDSELLTRELLVLLMAYLR